MTVLPMTSCACSLIIQGNEECVRKALADVAKLPEEANKVEALVEVEESQRAIKFRRATSNSVEDNGVESEVEILKLSGVYKQFPFRE